MSGVPYPYRYPFETVAASQTGQVLGTLRLGERAQTLYGAPYATIHRADLHALLWDAAQAAGVQIAWGQTIAGWSESTEGVVAQSASGQSWQADALVGADGVWSTVRQQLLADAPARFTGHLAFRALVPQADLPSALRSDEVTVWMGPTLYSVFARTFNDQRIGMARRGHDVDAIPAQVEIYIAQRIDLHLAAVATAGTDLPQL